MDRSTEKSEPTQSEQGQETPESPASKDVANKIQELEAQIKEKEQKYVYLYAEFDNYKKRMMKERADLMKFGWENVARELLEVIDNLERALLHMPKTEDHAHKTLEQGLNMVLNQFKATLEKQGIQRIDAASKEFDPNLHEAVAHEDSQEPEGRIVREESRGYTLHGRLLRPSRVVISSGQKTA